MDTGELRPLDLADRRAAAWLFVAFVCLYLLSSGGHFYASDAWQKFLTLKAMVFQGSVFFPEGWSPGIGGPTSFYPLGGSLLMLPGFAVGFALAPVAPMIPTDFVARFCITLQNAFLSAALVSVVFAFLRSLAYPMRACLFVAAALGLGSMVWPYAKTCWSEPGSTLFAFGAFCLLYRSSVVGFTRFAPLFAAGSLIGAALLVRLETVIVVPGALAWLLWRHRHDPAPLAWAAAVVAVPVALAVAGTLWFNAVRFGHPFTFSNWNAVQSVTPMPHGRLVWALQNLWHYTLNPGDALIWFSPVIVIGLVGWRTFHQDRPAASWLVLASIGPLFVFYFAFWGLSDWAWGMRYGYVFLPFLLLPAASAWTRLPHRRALWLGIVLVGVAIQAMAVLHNFGYLYERERARHPGLSIQQLMARPAHAPLLLAARDTPATLAGGVALLAAPAPRSAPDVASMRERSQFVPDFWWMLQLMTTMPRALIGAVVAALLAGLVLALNRLGRAVAGAEA